MIELYLWRQLDAFAKEGSLSRAAEALYISQPALSYSMKKIEDELGVPLFERKKGSIALNDTGRLAAEYAAMLLTQSKDIEERIVLYDRSRHSICFGSCAPYPVTAIIPLVHRLFGGMTITSELSDDKKLIDGLKNRTYQVAALRFVPDDTEIYSRKFTEERICITLPKGHRLADRQSVTFDELNGESILMQSHIGFWADVVRERMPASRLLVQAGVNEYIELIESTGLPFFNSDRMIELLGQSPDRVSIPISDDDAHASFYLACLDCDKNKYSALFRAAASINEPTA